MRRIAIVLLLLAAAPDAAHAHGRVPASTNLAPHPDDANVLLAGATFGLIVSGDGGASWTWICDQILGYDDATLDPALLVTSSGALLAGTFTSLQLSRDGGCSWTAAIDGHWVTALAQASDGALWAATGTSARANDVLVSRDDGASWQSTGLDEADVYWKSVTVAPSDPLRVYAAGVRISTIAGGGGTVQTPLLRRSDDGGAHWAPMAFTFADDLQVRLLGVAAGDPSLLFARVDGDPADQVWRSPDGGATFSPVLTLADNLSAFAALPDGSLLAGSRQAGVHRSTDGGMTWIADPAPPRLSCAAIGASGTLYGCASDDAPDFFALGAWNQAGGAWTPVLEFEQLGGPLACAAGTPQHDVCVGRWSLVADLLGIGPADAGPGASIDAGAPPGGDGNDAGCGCSIAPACLLIAWPPRRRQGRRSLK